jgi:hypothetical protein
MRALSLALSAAAIGFVSSAPALAEPFPFSWAGVANADSLRAPKVDDMYPGGVTLDTADGLVNLRPTGVGLREATFMKVDVFTVAHYLDATVPIPSGKEKTAGPALMELDAWKQLHIRFCRDIPMEKSLEGFHKAMTNSLGEEGFAALGEDVDRFLKWFEHDVVEDGTYTFTHIPGVGFRVEVGGEVQGVIENLDFARAYWSLYFGETPQSKDLRKQLLSARPS